MTQYHTTRKYVQLKELKINKFKVGRKVLQG